MDCFIYILKCSDGSYYTGHTDNLERRIAQHHSGAIEGYTSFNRPVKLVFAQQCSSRHEAFVAERQIKNWSKKKKKALVEGDWQALSLFGKKDFKKNNF